MKCNCIYCRSPERREHDIAYSARRRYRLRIANLCESCGRISVKFFGKCKNCLKRHDKNRK